MHHSFRKYLALSLFVLALFSACDNTVDINDEYKEIAIVYCLLDQSESTHYLKVTKAFLSEDNIYLAAADPKQSQYGADELEVWIEQYNPDGTVGGNVIYLDTCLIKNKEEGTFYFPEQIVYKTPDNTVLNNNLTYKLYIKNVKTGKLIDAQTKLIGNTRLMKPRENSKTLGLTGLFPVELQWMNGENGLVYDVSFRFFYTEINSAGVSSMKYIDWDQGRVRSESTSGSEDVMTTYYGPNFYTYLKNSITPPEQGMVRYMDSVHLILYGGNEDLSIYMDVNAPSTSIVQERPQYTNISNGMGIFASRYRYTKTFDQLANRSLDTLHLSNNTKDLGFIPRPF